MSDKKLRMQKENIVQILLALGIFLGMVLSKFLLGEDMATFLKWYLAAALMGAGIFLPGRKLFATFADRGWVFCKVLAIALTGYLTWALTCYQLIPFTASYCRLMTIVILLLVSLISICAGLIRVKNHRDTGTSSFREGLGHASNHASDQNQDRSLHTGQKINQYQSMHAGLNSYPDITLILWEELLFLLVFLAWTYIAGFHPAASGTEKFMDYGFMQSMMRSTTLPAKDIWFGTNNINYYYGGQYFAVFLTKLTGTNVKQTYNLARAFVAAFAFVLPFSLVWNMLRDKLNCHYQRESVGKTDCSKTDWNKAAGSKSDSSKADDSKAVVLHQSPDSARIKAPAYLGGMLAGIAVSLAGNMHYVLYGLLGSKLQLSGYEEYWFPDSTRYIGYNPDVGDKCIHEFPSYSFVLGDLHAHVVNIMFVLLLLGIVYAWLSRSSETPEYLNNRREKGFMKVGYILQPPILICGWLIGMFQWTNYWDFIIYLTVLFLASMIFAVWCDKNCESGNRGKGESESENQGQGESQRNSVLYRVLRMLIRDICVVVIAMIASQPFRMTFSTMVSGVALAKDHTMLHQLLILWGLPCLIVVIFAISLLWEGLRKVQKKYDMADLFAFLLGCCGLGLVLIPELVYVRDIYEENYPRANTMFKLTYQAFIMFGLAVAYILIRNIVCCKLKGKIRKALFRALHLVLLLALLLTAGYFPYAVKEWFGDIQDRSAYQGLDAEAFLETTYPEDAAAIRYLEENIEGSPIVLEAYGDSYSENCRVSAMTGLPTVFGWYVHEWLWRGDVAENNQRQLDIAEIYTSADSARVRELLDKYGVEYIFVGSCERSTYPAINDAVLQSMGEIVFDGRTETANGAYIIKCSE